eukprot:Hpha_TRINITY_DN3950_c0_g1::TRINITY_DN3950_c0_g1_i2::g.18090::m.18090
MLCGSTVQWRRRVVNPKGRAPQQVDSRLLKKLQLGTPCVVVCHKGKRLNFVTQESREPQSQLTGVFSKSVLLAVISASLHAICAEQLSQPITLPRIDTKLCIPVEASSPRERHPQRGRRLGMSATPQLILTTPKPF